MFFLINFYLISWLVSLYIQYVYVFHPDQFENVNDNDGDANYNLDGAKIIKWQ